MKNEKKRKITSAPSITVTHNLMILIAQYCRVVQRPLTSDFFTWAGTLWPAMSYSGMGRFLTYSENTGYKGGNVTCYDEMS